MTFDHALSQNTDFKFHPDRTKDYKLGHPI